MILGSGSQGQKDIYYDVAISSYPLIVTDAIGCIDTTWINMEIDECLPVKPAGGITPNDDGINDTWKIFNIKSYPNNEVFIFDRWGQRVYHKVG